MDRLQTYLRKIAEHWPENYSARFNKLLACGRAGCRRSPRVWRRLSGGTGSLALNGVRCCFPACFGEELARQLQEEVLPDGSQSPPRRIPLGLVMLSRGDLDTAQLRHALRSQLENGAGRIGEWIERLGYASERQVTSALGSQWACPVLQRLPARAVPCGVPFLLLQGASMVPIHHARSSRRLHVAFSSDLHYPLLLAIEKMLDCKTVPCLAASAAIGEMLALMDEEPKPEKVFDGPRRPQDVARIVTSYAERLRAKNVRTAASGKYLWIKIESEADSTDLLFARTRLESAAYRKSPSQRPGALTIAPRQGPLPSVSIPSAETNPQARPGVSPAESARRSP